MEERPLLKRSHTFVSKLRTDGEFVWTVCLVLAAVLALGFFFFGRAFHRTPPARSHLPAAVLPAGTLTLITEPDQGMAPVLSLIQSATHSIDLVMYEFDDKEIADALIAAHAHGIAVRVLLDRGYYGAADGMNDNAYAYLQKAGVPVEWTPARFALTHQKTLIVDNSTAMIMTFNFTPQYYATSRDFGILDTDPTDVQAIASTFTNDWNDKAASNEFGTDLVWSPGSESDMLLVIASAKKTLDVYNEEMADDTVTHALEAAEARGVEVRVVMTYTTAYKPAFAELSAAGVQVKTFGGGKHTLYIHAKMIAADGSEAFLGSENFSATSLDSNRELGLFISDPTILASLENTFATDFGNARPFVLK